jgi:hypothetical protein
MSDNGLALTSQTIDASGRPPQSFNEAALRVEAARYALVRRITPALRHHLVGAMQPLGMIAAMLERRAQAAAPDLASIQKKSTEMGQLSREATTTCIGLISWIAPKGAEAIGLSEGVLDCLHVLETDLALRGFSVVNEVKDEAGEWPREALRSTLCAALLALTDGGTGPADVVLSVAAGDGGPSVRAVLRPREGTHTAFAQPAWRALTRDDVAAIAADEGVELSMDAAGFELRCVGRD